MKKRNSGIRCTMALIAVLVVIAGLLQKLSTYYEDGNHEGGNQTESRLDLPQGKQEESQSVGNPNIRVLLLSTGYKDKTHSEVLLSSEGGLRISCGGETEERYSAEALQIAPDDARFQKGNIRVEPLEKDGEICVESIQRGYGTPSYNGALELRTTAEGIILINELPLESYLCRVVPSEMPASYELEALKAQAVCARSYACRQMQSYAYPEYEAHVNDSTDFQVYNNSPIQERSTRAVEETKGQVVRYQGQIVTTYYYSTSCGKTTSTEAWGNPQNETNQYLKSVPVCGKDGDYEKSLPWYRWEAQISAPQLSAILCGNTGKDIGVVSSLEVTKKGPGDVAEQIVATGEKGSITVDTENRIRTALGGSGYTITKNDGTVVDSMKLLPSAFFQVEKKGDVFIIKGGGFGHGIGMSQNGANEMAKQGSSYQEILQLFYQGVEIK